MYIERLEDVKQDANDANTKLKKMLIEYKLSHYELGLYKMAKALDKWYSFTDCNFFLLYFMESCYNANQRIALLDCFFIYVNFEVKFL